MSRSMQRAGFNRSSRLAACLVLVASVFVEVRAGPIDHVLVVRNGNSPISKAIADDYATRRGAKHVLTILCQDSAAPFKVLDRAVKLRHLVERSGYHVSNPLVLEAAVAIEGETLDFAAYRRDVEDPLRRYLAAHSDIDYIVLTKGIPIRVTGVPTPTGQGTYSLDSRLAALGYDSSNAVPVDLTDPSLTTHFGDSSGPFHAGAWANKFWNSPSRFSHARFGTYLVTRLDGYTEADAKALTTRSLAAESMAGKKDPSAGPVLFDIPKSIGFAAHDYPLLGLVPSTAKPGELIRVNGESDYPAFNSEMRSAAERLAARGIPAEVVETDHFVGDRSGLRGYMSWGSNDPQFNAAAYRSLKFVPGALSDTAVSTSARTFLPTYAGQSLIADLVAQGVTGVKGYTDEPLLQAVASPSILFDRYTRGWTLAESFYAASAFVGWQDIVIGDPIAQAYPLGEP